MQNSKLLPVVIMGIMSLGLISARAQDTPEQAAARAALMEKMAELDQAEPPAMTTPSAAPVTTSATPAPSMAPSTPPPSSDTTSAPITVTAPTAATPVDTMPSSTPAPAPMTSEPEFSPVPPPSGGATIAVTPQPSVAPAVIPQPSAGGYSQATQAALSQSQTNAVVMPAPSTPPPMVSTPDQTMEETNSVNTITSKQLGLQPLQPPPAPVSAQQQEALQSLLQRYEADQITPDEYQAERAKILAGQ